MAIPLLTFPLISHRHHAALFEREKEGIAADNAAILLGRGDVQWLTFVDRENRMLARWDQTHHIWHACRQFPPTAAKCAAADVAWETALRARHTEVGGRVQLAWQRARMQALAEVARLGATGVTVVRAPAAPLVPRLCPVCHLPTGWRVLMPVRSLIKNSREEASVSVAAGEFGDAGIYDYEIH